MPLARTAVAAAVACTCVGCAAQHAPTRAAPPASRAVKGEDPVTLYQDVPALAASLQQELDNLRNLRFVGMDDGPVPDFSVRSVDGHEYDSASLVGHRPFLVVFFATWCDSCSPKLASLRRSLDAQGPMLVIPVSVDGPETWQGVQDYLSQRGFSLPVVRARDQPSFTLSYNPFNSVPTVVVVGRNGGLVDYQMGYQPEDDARLASSLELARTIGPLATPH